MLAMVEREHATVHDRRPYKLPYCVVPLVAISILEETT